MRRFITSVVVIVLTASACTSGSSLATVPSPSSTAAPSSTSTGVVVEPTTATAPVGESTVAVPSLDATALRLEVVADGFEQPVFYVTVGEHGFVVDQPGVIWRIAPGDDPSVFLDISDRVRFNGEQGLLGLAFHPDLSDRLYVNYTGHDGRTVVSEFLIDPALSTTDPATERVVLEVQQPAANHNGGMIAFGPEGNLWIGMGDGGASNDKFGNGQRGDTVLGAMLRIEVGPDVIPYGIVEDHEFAAEEVWAIGLRNPWRFSFDGDDLWIADVGQGDIEEIDRVSVDDRGLNLGWPIYEGTECFAGPCDAAGLVLPDHEYTHDEGCSITGGYVYRGPTIPQLDGHYFFSDWCNGFIRSIAPDGSVHDWTDGTGTVPEVTSLGRDAAGEVYVVSGTGTVYRIAKE